MEKVCLYCKKGFQYDERWNRIRKGRNYTFQIHVHKDSIDNRTFVIWSADGSGVSTVSAGRVFTIATLNVINVYVCPLAVASSTTASADLHGLPEGGFIVGQGNYVMFSHVTTVATGIGSFAWVEVPA